MYFISDKVESTLMGTTMHPSLRIEKHETIQFTEFGKIMAIVSPRLILKSWKHLAKFLVCMFSCSYVIFSSLSENANLFYKSFDCFSNK